MIAFVNNGRKTDEIKQNLSAVRQGIVSSVFNTFFGIARRSVIRPSPCNFPGA